MVKVEMIKHNFNEVFAQMYMKHTEDVIRRLWNGDEPGYEPGAQVDINEGEIGFRKAVCYSGYLNRIDVATRAEF